jgi:hypothetical protein
VRATLPRTRVALEESWDHEFDLHVAEYTPLGPNLVVDDAWAFAERCQRRGHRDVARAAHDDLLLLRLRYHREGPGVLRRRSSPGVGLFLHGRRRLVVRLPGIAVRTLTLQLP